VFLFDRRKTGEYEVPLRTVSMQERRLSTDDVVASLTPVPGRRNMGLQIGGVLGGQERRT